MSGARWGTPTAGFPPCVIPDLIRDPAAPARDLGPDFRQDDEGGRFRAQTPVPADATPKNPHIPPSLPPRSALPCHAMRMRRDLEHVPERQREELARAVAILQAGFEEATALSTSGWKKSGRILRIVLFGSYARGDWVDDKVSGYQSDFDLLIVVNDKRLTDVAEFWHAAEDRLIADPGIARPVNFIVHSLEEVNAELARGQYFFTDIVKEGVALFEASGAKAFKTPTPMTADDALELAEAAAKQWSDNAVQSLEIARFAQGKDWSNKSAFSLHQAVEAAYHGFLLVHTHYSPQTHNIKFLRSLAEDLEPELRAVWPRDTREARRRFERLKRAYVEARYSEHYAISDADLVWLGERAEALIAAVETACAARVAALKKDL